MNRPNPTLTFLNEAEDLLARIEATALDVLPGDPPGEAVHQLFRAFHTIKGSGAMFGFDAVAGFTHHVETVLDKVRDGIIPVSPDLINLILASKDRIKALLDAAQAGTEAPAETGRELVARLSALLPKSAPAPAAAPRPAAPQSPPPATPGNRTYTIRFKPHPGLLTSGTDPRRLLDELRALGDCQVAASAAEVPALQELKPDQCYLSWTITLSTGKDVNAIRDVFIFVEDQGELSIQPAPTEVPAAILPESRPAAPSAPAAPATAARVRPAKDSTVRVPSERLDRLVMLVGEMVMNQSRLTQVTAAVNDSHLTAPVEELERLVCELRDNVLGIRMMPIGTTFNHFKRLVHDLAAELHKEIDLVTEGGDTELDKTVLDQLGDPLVHLIRNSVDHGLEPADARQHAGKPRRGRIRLAAVHTGSNVIVTIQDDGRGLDAAAIRAKAIEKKLVAPDANLSRDEIFNLILLPGFSTAAKVTSVSGRGVGMDVVKRQMDALRGSLQISSEPGRGTTVSLTLPLTLAIIDGLLVQIGPDRFIIPMSAVAENVELPRRERIGHHRRNLIAVRGEQIPYIRLREDFEIDGPEPDNEKIVIALHNHERVGIVVDHVLGSHQTVIQSLGRFYKNIGVVSGATIMGDGRVALILDVLGLIRFSEERARQRQNAPAVASGDRHLAITTHLTEQGKTK